MPENVPSPRAAASYDWSTSVLGEPVRWPAPLRVAADLLLNSPLPGLLVWGRETVLVFNEGTEPPGTRPPPMPARAA